MSTIHATPGARTALTTTALNALASAAYVSAGTIDVSAQEPLDLIIEVEATPGTVAGNRQLMVFARISMDGTHFSTGPVSGSSTNEEPNLRFLGVLPLPTSAVLQRAMFSVAAALGFVPPHIQIVIKNDSGAALAASGHAVHHTSYVGTTA
ncbi:hypothetical protein [Hydrogenophaga sp.]|uniref:hypothetical protein n=1 Tax=Hydrogenophaga sp. TaxID=1904254 RepID=UPI003F72A7F6